MSYTKQNFKDGQTLNAEHLNHMEDGIGVVESDISKAKTDISNISKNVTNMENDISDIKEQLNNGGGSSSGGGTVILLYLNETLTEVSSDLDGVEIYNTLVDDLDARTMLITPNGELLYTISMLASDNSIGLSFIVHSNGQLTGVLTIHIGEDGSMSVQL